MHKRKYGERPDWSRILQKSMPKPILRQTNLKGI